MSRSFGPFSFDPDRRTLTRDGQGTELGQRACTLLQALLAAQGQPVARATLLDEVWPDTTVEEGNLTVQIAALRKLLGPEDWIITVPRVGYRLMVPQPPQPLLIGSPRPALAVLPFVNLSGDPAQDYFADGVVEDIITALSRFKTFAVIARNSSFTYKGQTVDVGQVGHDLGVRYFLEGSLRRAGDHLRISTQLIECVGAQRIRAETFDGLVEQVFEFPDRITESVVSRVAPSIQQAEIERSRRERPGSLAAYDLYLQAMPLFQSSDETVFAQAYELLSRAILLEPDKALFLAVAANYLSTCAILGWPPIASDDFEVCANLISRALHRAPWDANVLVYCADALLHFQKDYDRAMSVARAALDANPNDFLVVVRVGIVHLHCGSLEDAVACLLRAIQLNPRDPAAFIPLAGIAHVYMVLAEFEQALTRANRSLTINPIFPCNFWMLIAANAQLGRMDEAPRHLAQFLKLQPGITISRIRAGQPDKDPSRMAATLDRLRLAGLPNT